MCRHKYTEHVPQLEAVGALFVQDGDNDEDEEEEEEKDERHHEDEENEAEPEPEPLWMANPSRPASPRP